jgi:hypothetical protein
MDNIRKVCNYKLTLPCDVHDYMTGIFSAPLVWGQYALIYVTAQIQLLDGGAYLV